MEYRAIIFDLDGVICHTDQYHYQAWKRMAEPLGIPFDQRINQRLRGVSRMQSLEILLEAYPGALSDEKKQQLTEEKNQYYRELLGRMTPADLDPDVWETLEQLRSRGVTMAIGSSSRNAGFILQRLGLGDYFDAVVDGNAITHSKPHPEVFLLAAEALHQPARCCLVVEDAPAGVQAAHAAGMHCATIGDAASGANAEYHLQAFSDLLAL